MVLAGGLAEPAGDRGMIHSLEQMLQRLAFAGGQPDLLQQPPCHGGGHERPVMSHGDDRVHELVAIRPLVEEGTRPGLHDTPCVNLRPRFA
jgi:hypothetical protein